MKIEFFEHSIDRIDIENVNNVLNSIFLTTGSIVSEFEEAFSKYLGCGRVVGVTNGTAALQLSLLAWGIGEGDEVITTPLTFCATSNSILNAGAKPIFSDVEKNTGNIDVNLIESKITEKTKAIIPVHLYGQMCDMKKLRLIADKYNLIIIEDAAHCIEGTRDGIRVGQLGDAACFSFYATKNITCGEGGAIATNSAEKADLLSRLRLHGINKSAADRYSTEFQHWDMTMIGLKCNMSNIQAALLINQLKRIEALLKKRDDLANYYEQSLSPIKDIELFKPLKNSKHSRHLFNIHVPADRRDECLAYLKNNGIGVAVNYNAVHTLTYYRQNFSFAPTDFPIAYSIGQRTISLPLYPGLSREKQDYIISKIKDFFPLLN